MKNAIVYGLIFLIAFAAVSGALIFLNTQYKNIFAFDFSPEMHQQDSTKVGNAAHADSLHTDSTSVVKDSSLVSNDSTKIANHLLQAGIAEVKDTKVTPTKKPEVLPVTENPMLPKTNMTQSAKKDSIYNAWIKETVKLYEAMDSKKVAKVILGYSDNIARDIILRMRKKKAAEVLSEFKPEVVTRLISVN